MTVVPFFSKNVIISKEELSEIKCVSPGHLQLLGFKPLTCLRDHYNLKPSTFLYPSDEVSVQSIIWAANLICARDARGEVRHKMASPWPLNLTYGWMAHCSPRNWNSLAIEKQLVETWQNLNKCVNNSEWDVHKQLGIRFPIDLEEGKKS